MQNHRLLKRDVLGSIASAEEHGRVIVLRDTSDARWGVRWLARFAARREEAALRALEGVAGVPSALGFDGRVLKRTYMSARPMHLAKPSSPLYFKEALTLLRRMHARGVAHNDLAKEPNWLCTSDGRPAIIDFQLAWVSKRRSRWFRLLAREDLRHLLKHKRTYVPSGLSPRQRAMLASPTCPARAWRALAKPLYLLFTRSLLGWRERAGPAERGQRGE